MTVSRPDACGQYAQTNTMTTIETLPTDTTAATLRTLEVMAQAIRGELEPDRCGFRSEAVRTAAIEATKTATDEPETITAWFEWVRDGVRYIRDPYDTDLVQDACTTLKLRAGDCDDRCVLLCSGLLALGFLPRLVAQHNGQEFTHVYVEVFDEAAQTWVALDPTGNGTGVRPLLRAGERVPAFAELRFDVFTGETKMSQGLGSTWGDYSNSLFQSSIPYDPNLDWYDLAARGIDVVGAAVSDSRYVSPDDPRYRPSIYNNYPVQTLPNGRANTAAVDLTNNGVKANIPFWVWALGGGLVVAFLLGQRRR